MKFQKYQVEFKETGETKNYHSFKEIADDLHIEYYQVREIYSHNKKPKRFLHPISQNLVSQISLYDNPNIKKIHIQLKTN
jgi:DNA-directed RNA polymerase sigma subunit (sigma70/sigma32)